MKFSRDKSQRRFQVPPSKFKALCDQYGVPMNFISRFLGLSYPYTCTLLNGYAQISPEIESKLVTLLNSVKNGVELEDFKGGLSYEK